MAGKQCMGTTDVPNDPALSKAYCEGRSASVAGTLKANNPHPSGSANADAWDLGHDSYVSGGLTPGARDCCADLPLGA